MHPNSSQLCRPLFLSRGSDHQAPHGERLATEMIAEDWDGLSSQNAARSAAQKRQSKQDNGQPSASINFYESCNPWQWTYCCLRKPYQKRVLPFCRAKLKRLSLWDFMFEVFWKCSLLACIWQSRTAIKQNDCLRSGSEWVWVKTKRPTGVS